MKTDMSTHDRAVIPIIIPSLEPDERFPAILSDLSEAGLAPVIVVDDGSSDAYRHFFDQAEREYDAVVLRHDVNRGKGRALKTAFSYCLEQYDGLVGCVTADSDGQHTAECIRKVREALLEHSDDLVLGVRDFSDREVVPQKGRFGNTLTCRVFHALYGVRLRDTQTGLRGIPSTFMRQLLDVEGERFEFETQMLIEAVQTKRGFFEVPIETVYDSVDHHTTHYKPVADSVRVYRLFFASFIRFAISGFSSFVIDLLLFSLFCRLFKGMEIGIGYIALATACARVISAVYNCLLNYRFVFRSKKSYGGSLLRYTALAAAQMAASAGLTTALCLVFPAKAEVLVKLCVDACLFFISYRIQKRYVY